MSNWTSWLLLIGGAVLMWAGLLYWLWTSLNCSVVTPCGQ